MQLRGGIGRQVKGEVGARCSQRNQACAEQESLFLRCKHLTDRRACRRCLQELRSFVDFVPDIHADGPHQQSKNKRHTPAPRVQVVRRQRAGQHKTEKSSQ